MTRLTGELPSRRKRESSSWGQLAYGGRHNLTQSGDDVRERSRKFELEVITELLTDQGKYMSDGRAGSTTPLFVCAWKIKPGWCLTGSNGHGHINR
jgi:hypothetical protein